MVFRSSNIILIIKFLFFLVFTTLDFLIKKAVISNSNSFYSISTKYQSFAVLLLFSLALELVFKKSLNSLVKRDTDFFASVFTFAIKSIPNK